MPFLSVIVPVFNKVNYVDECVSSILDQTFTDFELILVNDGSTDGSEKKCDYYAKADNRVRVIHQQNKGVSAARNAGLTASLGKYIGFVDSDDAIEKDMYQVLVDNATETEADISICGIVKIYKNKVRNLNNDSQISVFDKDEGLLKMLEGSFDMSANNKIFRSGIALNTLFEGNFKEDFLYNVKAFLKADKIVFQNASKYIYKLRENSVSIKKFTALDMEGLGVDEQIMELVSGMNDDIRQESRINYFVQNLSTLNLILLFSKRPYPDDYKIIKNNLLKYEYLTAGSQLKAKHRLAYSFFKVSPVLYKFLLEIYILLFPSEVGIRDK